VPQVELYQKYKIDQAISVLTFCMSTYGEKRNNTKTTNPTTLPQDFYLGGLEGFISLSIA
jgi:hypothetical protein